MTFTQSMRVGVVLIASIVLFSGGVTVAEDKDREQPPRVLISDLQHDFGTVGQQRKVEHQFQISNVGDASLEIKDIRSSCDCLTELMGKREIAPGEQLPLKVIFDTQHYVGRQSRFVEIYFNDPTTDKLRLEVRANVRKDYVVEPGFLNFQGIAKGRGAEREISLRQLSAIPLQGLVLDASAPWLNATPVVVNSDVGTEYRIVVQVQAGAPVGRHSEVLSLGFTQGDRRNVDVPVIVDIEGNLQVRPSRLTLGRVSKATAPNASVTLTGLKPDQVVDVDIDLPFLTPVEQPVGSHSLVLGVLVDATAPAGNFQGQMTLKTDVDGEQDIIIPVSGQVVR